MNIYHNASPWELEKYYGQFLLKNYVVGGKAFANIGFESRSSKSTSVLKEESSFMASVSFSGLFGKIGGNVDYQSKEAKENFRKKIAEYTNSSMRISATGGDVSSFPLPPMYTHGDITENNLPKIDFMPWLQTVKANPTLISINKYGLIPLYDLVREKNISRNIKNYFLTGENIDPEEQKIGYTFYRMNESSREVLLVLSTRYGDNFIIDRFYIPTVGFEWWYYCKVQGHTNIPLSEDLSPRLAYEKDLPRKNLIDLTEYLCSSDKEKVKVRFCKIKNSRYKEDMSYLLIENRETRKRLAFSLYDEQAFFDYYLKEPDTFEEIRNINFYELYGL